MKDRGIMDHCPMILKVHVELEKFSKPFQYFNHMSKIEGFHNVVTKAWSSSWFGDLMGILCRKSKLVKKELITLNKLHGNVHTNVQNARLNLKAIQDQLGLTPTVLILVKVEHEASRILEATLAEQKKLLLPKSRVKWFKQGYGNNSIF